MASAKAPFTRQDLVVGSVIALVMASAFHFFSPGLALTLTFVPGMIFAYVLFLLIACSNRSPQYPAAATLYFIGIGLQILHCAEEYCTGFHIAFPTAYGARPFSPAVFLGFNVLAYIVFAVAGIAVFQRDTKPMLIPVLFFVVYGTCGNAISHLTWCAMSGGYFPGAATALLFAFFGPVLISKFGLGIRGTTIYLIALSIALIGGAMAGFRP